MNFGIAMTRFAQIVRLDKDELTVRCAVSGLCQLQGKEVSPFFTELLAGELSISRKELLEEALLKVSQEAEKIGFFQTPVIWKRGSDEASDRVLSLRCFSQIIAKQFIYSLYSSPYRVFSRW